MIRNCLILLLACAALPAQRTGEYDRSVVSQVRIDLRELGYPPADVIPPDESAVRSLAVAPNGVLYGATSGRRSHLFALDPLHGYVVPLGFLKGVTSVHRSLAVSDTGEVYIGAGGPDGRLLKYTPRRVRAIPVEAALEVESLGAPAAGEGIYCLAMDRSRGVIYGLTSPNGQFFSYSISAAKFALHGKVAERTIPGEKFESEKAIGRALAVAADGGVYTSGENGALFRFHPGKQQLERLPSGVPSVPGREACNRVDAFAWTAPDTLYGGSSDGYLFRLNTKTSRIENLGKPLNQYRIRGLVFSPNGKLYGVGGDDDEMARLFSYHPASGAYELLGMVDVNRRPYYAWQAYVIDAVAIGLDGTVYLGQAERKSKLYLYHP